MRGLFYVIIVIALGLGLGGALSWFSIQKHHGFGALTLGQWTAWPLAGSRDADPYTRAKVAAEGNVPLGAAEGLAFHARTDNRKKPLRLQCQYLISGQTPTARFWTLAAHDLEGQQLSPSDSRSGSVLSQTMLRQDLGQFIVQSGPDLAKGNWLQTEGNGEYQLILRLYDSPITSTRGLVDPSMPDIELLGCRS